jgi:hypothetical protein
LALSGGSFRHAGAALSLGQSLRQRIEVGPRDLAPAQPSAQNNFPGSVNPVELENVLRDIDPDRANLAYGWLLFLVIFDDHHFDTQMPWGAIHPISLNCNSRLGTLAYSGSGLALTEVTSGIAHDGRPKGHLENQLTYGHANIQNDFVGSEVNHFQLNLSFETRMDRRGC